MITRVCISINNKCNLRCKYCHFNEKEFPISNMNVIEILDNITAYIDKNNIDIFKIGFVGNGEPFLDYPLLIQYIKHIEKYLKSGQIEAYTITNGTLVKPGQLLELKEFNVSVCYSLDGNREIHNKNRNNTFDKVMESIEMYKTIYGHYPPLNATVGADTCEQVNETIEFFKKFDSKITFSRMIGTNGISVDKYQSFIQEARKQLNIRTGKYDCTMYGGKCAAGINNLFFANGYIYLCGNCIDLPPLCSSNTPLDEIPLPNLNFDRNKCYKDSLNIK